MFNILIYNQTPGAAYDNLKALEDEPFLFKHLPPCSSNFSPIYRFEPGSLNRISDHLSFFMDGSEVPVWLFVSELFRPGL